MFIGGYDVSYAKESGIAAACLTVFDENQGVIEEHLAEYVPEYDYIPGKLYLREKKGLELLLPKVGHQMSLLVIDGNASIHPEKSGAGCKYAEIFSLPTVGVAKKLMVGHYDSVGRKKGSKSKIIYDDEHVGYAFRSVDDVKPIFISCGKDLSLDQSVEIILPFCNGYRIPKVIRRPDIVSRKYLRDRNIA